MELSEEDKYETQDLYPIAVLIEELKSDIIKDRLKSINSLPTIALALGEERCRSELIAVISNTIYDDDEILLALVEQIGNLVPYIGGSEYAYTLLEPLDTLTAVEDQAVREKAANVTAILISEHLSKVETHIETYAIPFLNNLATNDWFTKKYAACMVLPSIYPHVDQKEQFKLLDMYMKLSDDEMPLVRKAAAAHLEKLVEIVASPNSYPFTDDKIDFNQFKNGENNRKRLVTEFLLPVFESLNQSDENEAVRIFCVNTALAFVKNMDESSDKDKDYFSKILLDFVSDKSWKVRQAAVKKFVDFMNVFGQVEMENDEIMCHSFMTLLQDSEENVRASAVGQLKDFILALEDSNLHRHEIILDRIIPILEKLVQDLIPEVKAKVATTLIEICPLISEEIVKEHIIPQIIILLRSECVEAKINVISELSSLDPNLGEILLETILPVILDLLTHKQWRIRLDIIEHLPLLAGQLKHDTFEEKLTPYCLDLLNDEVYAIRETSCKNIKHFVNQYGVDWANQKVIPKLQELAKNGNYLRRMTSLFAITELVHDPAKLTRKEVKTSKTKSEDPLKSRIPSSPTKNESIRTVELFLPTILALADDKIPNVRFNVAIALESMYGSITDETEVKSTLEKLAKDEDTDVKFYAERAQKTLGFVC